VRRALFAATATVCLIGGCSSSHVPPTPDESPSAASGGGRADIGGFELAYECEGEGEPTVILEAGLGTGGLDEFLGFIDQVAARSRVCTYDRAGTDVSGDRPEGEHVTAALMADELHALLEAIDVEPPIVLVAHSYGGMPARMFAARYPDDVAGLVLIDVSSEPEVPVYERLDAGPWIDGTDRIDIHATVRELRAAGNLGDTPLVIVTAGVIEDEWLATVPALASRAQVRLAGLSSDSVHVVAPDSGHFVHRDDPAVVLAAIDAMLSAVRSGSGLTACEDAFSDTDAECVPAGALPTLTPMA